MAQHSASPANGPSAIEREANHDDDLINGHRFGETAKEAREGESGLNNPIQAEQDSRVEKAKADATAAGGGPDKAEEGLNQDG